MRKSLIVLLVFFSTFLFGQVLVTPVKNLRVANATTAFGVGISDGDKVWNIATEELWIANTGIASTATLTTAAGSFNLYIDIGDLQNSLVSVFYNFKTNDYIEYIDNDDLDVGDNDFSLIIRFRKDDVSGTEYLINKEAGGVGYGIYIIDDDVYVRFDDNTTDASGIILTAKIVADKWYTLGISFDRSANATAYLNGTITGMVDISSANLTLSNAGNLRIGCTSVGASFFDGDIAFWMLENRTLSASEMLEISKWDSDSPPVWYSDIGASNTEYITTPDFSTAVGWSLIGNATIAGGNCTMTGDGTSNNYFGASNLWSDNAKDEKYIKLQYEIVSNTLTGTPFVEIGNISGSEIFTISSINITPGIHIIEKIPDKGGAQNRTYFQVKNEVTGGTIVFDNVHVTQVGCVLNANGSGMTDDTLYDNSGNDLNGAVEGATLVNNGFIVGKIEHATTDLDKFLATTSITGKIEYCTGTELRGYIGAQATLTPAALTKADDTNVTLTLGGTPSTALLQATSLTLGWTGTLADGRIASSTDWNTAYTDRLKWDGGVTGLTPATGRTSLGATTVGSNLFTLPNPSAIRFLRLNAANTTSALNATDFRTAIGAGTSSTVGTVTSVGFADGTGFTISGSPITSNGSFTFVQDFSEFTDITESTGIKFIVTDPAEKEIAIGNVDLSDFNNDAFANTALSNLSSVAINTALLLGTSDAFALGSIDKLWSDLFLAPGGVVTWKGDAGNTTLIHSGGATTPILTLNRQLVLASGLQMNAANILTTGYIGRDSDNYLSWSTDNHLKIKINGVERDIVSISTGASDNDKLITQGYADDAANSWQTWTGASRTSDATITSTTNLTVGTPIKYRATAGTWRYAVISGISANVHTLKGTSCTLSDDDEFQYGVPELVVTETFHIDGAFADAAMTVSATAGLLYNDLNMKFHYIWKRPKAYLVQMTVACMTADATTDPTINTRVSLDNSTYTSVFGSNIDVDISLHDTGATAVNTTYDLDYDDNLDFSIAVSGTGDAKDITIFLTFVLE